jgi:hypothetical protein
MPKRPAKKPTKQLDLPAAPAPQPQPTINVFPMELRVGNRLTDETGEYEVVGRPYTTNAGKDVHVRVKRVDNAAVTMIRTWAAHERVAVKRG